MLSPAQDIREYFRRIPTADLYFLHPLRRLGQEQAAGRLPPIRNIAPNVYAVGRTGVIVRYGAAADLNRLSDHGVRQLVYIADDDFEAGAADPLLPERYRARLAAFAGGDWPALRAAADIVLVSSPVLAATYGAKSRIVDPVWRRPPATSSHFARADRFEIAHLGTGSHAADLALIAPHLAAILDKRPNARLTLVSPGEVPDALARHARVRRFRPMSWWRYKIALARRRFHLALYPLRDSPFNRARSANKLLEHALVGAASLMSPTAALRDAAGADLPDVFVEGGADAWLERLDQAVGDFETCRRRAEAARQRILWLDSQRRTEAAWLKILEAEMG